MSKRNHVIGSVVVVAIGLTAGATAAIAQDAGPSMKFLGAPARAVAMGPAEHEVYPLNYRGTMTVVVKDPARCGQEPRAASFRIEGDTLQLQYSLPPLGADNVTAGASGCEAISVFTFHNLPADVQHVVALARPEAPAIAKVDAGHESASMSFIAASAQPVGEVAHHATYPLRDHDTMLVTVKDAAPCGARATNPTFRIVENTLQVHYTFEESGVAKPGNCEATAVFRFHNLPDRTLQLVASADFAPEPLALAPSAQRMSFLAAPAKMMPANAAPAALTSARLGDRMTIVLKDATGCGERASRPSIEVLDGTLHLRYTVPATGSGAIHCTATEVFAVHDLPPGLMHVVSEARHPLTEGAL